MLDQKNLLTNSFDEVKLLTMWRRIKSEGHGRLAATVRNGVPEMSELTIQSKF
jgi:hypothetical protein